MITKVIKKDMCYKHPSCLILKMASKRSDLGPLRLDLSTQSVFILMNRDTHNKNEKLENSEKE